MPTYEYQCQECGHLFEVFQSMKEKPVSECPQCKGKVKRLIGPGAGLIFKGSGFYITDYKNKSSSGNGASSGRPSPASVQKEDASANNKKSSSSNSKTSN